MELFRSIEPRLDDDCNEGTVERCAVTVDLGLFVIKSRSSVISSTSLMKEF